MCKDLKLGAQRLEKDTSPVLAMVSEISGRFDKKPVVKSAKTPEAIRSDQ